MIQPSTLDFLRDLKYNNNREWFQENKQKYEEAHQNFKDFVEKVRQELEKSDAIEKVKYYRIYRDLRFSKDKTPYKIYFASHFTREGRYRRGGFYLEISAEEAWVGGGFWNPSKDNLNFIRKGIDGDANLFRNALNNPAFKKRFDGLKGEELKTAPKGYEKDEPNIDLLKKKQYFFSKTYPAETVRNPDFYREVAADYASLIPVLQVMTNYLVFDGNGIER